MAKGVIGQPFVFTVLFLDTDGTPVTPSGTPTIEVFYFADSGTKMNVVPVSTPMVAVSPVEVGRYVYVYTIDAALQSYQQLYAVMRGIHPGSGDTMVAEVEVDLFYEATADITTSFIGPDNC